MVTWPSLSLALAVRGASLGAATAAGVPTDCLTTAGPKGPHPAPLWAWTRIEYWLLLTRPLNVVVSVPPATTRVPPPAPPDVLTHCTWYWSTALPSLTGADQLTASVRSPGVTVPTETARGAVSGVTSCEGALGADQSTALRARTVNDTGTPFFSPLTVHGEAGQISVAPVFARTSYWSTGRPPSLAGGDQLTRASPPATRSAVALTRCGASGAPRRVTRISPFARRPGPSEASNTRVAAPRASLAALTVTEQPDPMPVTPFPLRTVTGAETEHCGEDNGLCR